MLIEALETRYGKGQTTDKLQQEFYKLRNETKVFSNLQDG